MSRPTIAFVFLPMPNTMVDPLAQSQYQALRGAVRENSGAQWRKLRSSPPKSVATSYDSVARPRKPYVRGEPPWPADQEGQERYVRARPASVYRRERTIPVGPGAATQASLGRNP